MTIAELMDRVESRKFSTRITLGSSYRSCLRNARQADEIRELERRAEDNSDVVLALLRRVQELSQISVDPRYENPYDAALLGYLVALKTVSVGISQEAAAAVQGAPNLWLASRFARRILTAGPEEKTKSNAGDLETDKPRTSATTSSGERVHYTRLFTRTGGIVASVIGGNGSTGDSSAQTQRSIPDSRVRDLIAAGTRDLEFAA